MRRTPAEIAEIAKIAKGDERGDADSSGLFSAPDLVL
jgi:hypothetical protein